jgi:hypothetical protein
MEKVKTEALPQYFNQAIWCFSTAKMVVLNPNDSNGVKSANDNERVSLKQTYPFMFKK